MPAFLKLLLPAVVVLLVIGYFSKVKTIELVGAGSCTSEEQINSKYGIKEKLIFQIQSDNLQKNLPVDIKCIKSAQVTKVYPQKIKINLEIRQTIAKIEGTNFYLDENANILTTTGINDIATIFLPDTSNLNADTKIEDEKAIFAVGLIKNLQKSDFIAQTVRFTSENDIAVYNAGGVLAVFTRTRDANSQVDSLQFILGKAKIDATKIEKIDLRFDKPVITYE